VYKSVPVWKLWLEAGTDEVQAKRPNPTMMSVMHGEHF